jgi:hypothetical protein
MPVDLLIRETAKTTIENSDFDYPSWLRLQPCRYTSSLIDRNNVLTVTDPLSDCRTKADHCDVKTH